jgi:hypothetical protein
MDPSFVEKISQEKVDLDEIPVGWAAERYGEEVINALFVSSYGHLQYDGKLLDYSILDIYPEHVDPNKQTVFTCWDNKIRYIDRSRLYTPESKPFGKCLHGHPPPLPFMWKCLCGNEFRHQPHFDSAALMIYRN